MSVKIYVTADEAIVPHKATKESAGFDLFPIEPFFLDPGERHLVNTGLKFRIPDGYEVQIRPRSGLAYKHGVTVLNSPGTIDSDYRGEIKVLLINHGTERYVHDNLAKAIAQAVVAPVTDAIMVEIESDTYNTFKSDRGDGGFGSTDKNK